MKNEQALRIASNFFEYTYGWQPRRLEVSTISPDGRRIIIDANKDSDEEYEIEVDEVTGRVTIRKVVADNLAGEFTEPPKKISQLKPGELFRQHGGDINGYRFIGSGEVAGRTEHHYSFAGAPPVNPSQFREFDDITVFPLPANRPI